MEPIDVTELDELFALKDATVVGIDGEKIGKVEQVWVDNVNGLPEWAEVKMGHLLGARSRYVPLRAAEIGEGEVKVAYTKDQVESAPGFQPGQAGPAEERGLYRHYGQPLPAPPPPEVRNPFDRLKSAWVPGVAEKAGEYGRRANTAQE